MDKALTDFITEYRDYITLFTGIVLAVGAVKNWNWLCNPVKPDAQLLSRGMYRLIFGALGLILIFCGAMMIFGSFKPRHVPAYFWRAWFNTYILRCNDDIWMNG